MYKKILGIFSKDMGIDLGTAQTCVYVWGQGIVISESSVVAIKRDNSGPERILAVGNEAKTMLGRTPGNIIATRPLKDGVIADFNVTHAMLQHFISKVHNRRYGAKPRIVISIPSNITDVEKRAVKESAYMAGARTVLLVEEPMAAAIGANLPVAEPTANMVVDIGGGTTEVAIISLGGLVLSKSVRIGGDRLDEAIVEYIKNKHNLLIGLDAAEKIKQKIGSACPGDYDCEQMEVKGRDVVKQRPAHLSIGSIEVRQAMQDDINSIIRVVRLALEEMPPDLAADTIDNGIVLAGGGALLKGLSQLISKETSLPVVVAEDPMYTVVKGVGMILDNLEMLKEAALE